MQFKNIIATIAALSVASVLASPIAAEKAVAAPAVKRDEFHYKAIKYHEHREVWEQSADWARQYYSHKTLDIDYERVYQEVTEQYGQNCLDNYWGSWDKQSEGKFPFSVLFILGALYQDSTLFVEAQGACIQLVIYYQEHYASSGSNKGGFTTGGVSDETGGDENGTGGDENGTGGDENGNGGDENGTTGDENRTTGNNAQNPTPNVFDSFNHGIFQKTNNIVNGDSNTSGIQGNDNDGNTIQSGNKQVVNNQGGFLNGLLGGACILSRC